LNSWGRQFADAGYTPNHGIIGVDPGSTTGLFGVIVGRNDDDCIAILTAYGQTKTDVGGSVDIMLQVMRAMSVPQSRLNVAIEKYIITQRTAKLTRQPAALEVTGVVKDITRSRGGRIWEFTASNAKKFASDDLLERVGWMEKKGYAKRHARDAARQAWTCLAEVDFPAWEVAWEASTDWLGNATSADISLNELMDGDQYDHD
jgi:hypothetical protein